ncbi:hypothetical protein JTE90_015005 [Oedothorax gibbosus]|uniref:Uncharacterized protein n=1 Tax=Oedothorax gibbosus TaxID=931172 RepID=A0AAV6TW66_9ARAC|nr:hypothetical protein JTE90_015005 [Oedothorax gibbosus]
MDADVSDVSPYSDEGDSDEEEPREKGLESPSVTPSPPPPPPSPPVPVEDVLPASECVQTPDTAVAVSSPPVPTPSPRSGPVVPKTNSARAVTASSSLPVKDARQASSRRSREPPSPADSGHCSSHDSRYNRGRRQPPYVSTTHENASRASSLHSSSWVPSVVVG